MRLCRVCFFTLSLLGTALLGACSLGPKSPAFEDLGVPSPGAPLSPEYWQAAEQAAADDPLMKTRLTYWPVPPVMDKKGMVVSADRQTVSVHGFRYFGLGVGPVSLPIHFSARRDLYHPGKDEAAGSEWFGSWPVWSWDGQSGETTEDYLIESSGIPLFYEHDHYKADNWYMGEFSAEFNTGWSDVETHSTLLWLGPLWTTIRSSEFTEEGEKRSEIRLCEPLALLLLPGMVVWTSHFAHVEKPDNSTYTSHGHGPLGGILTYFDMTTRNPSGVEKFRRYVLASLLWSDFRTTMHDGTVSRSAHGPLGAMFGWGSKDGAPTVRFLWIPIKVG